MGKKLLKEPLKHRMGGDTLEVRLWDSSWNLYYKRKVDFKDEKRLGELLDDLREKGLKLPVKESKKGTWWD